MWSIMSSVLLILPIGGCKTGGEKFYAITACHNVFSPNSDNEPFTDNYNIDLTTSEFKSFLTLAPSDSPPKNNRKV